MKWSFLILGLISRCAHLLPALAEKHQPIRTINLHEEQVAEIKVALGYSTILIFDNKPSSVVVGDQDAFKVEFMGKSLTIKPLLSNSQSNLFVFYDYERFSFKIKTVEAQFADFTVKVKKLRQDFTNVNPTKPIQQAVFITKPVKTLVTQVEVSKREASCQGVQLILKKITYDDQFLFFYLSLINKSKFQTIPYYLSDLELQQRQKPVWLERLLVEGLSLPQNYAISVEMKLKKAALSNDPELFIKFSPVFFRAENRECSQILLHLKIRAATKTENIKKKRGNY